ncbi:hypothetical protein [Fervidobacterium gondwanense]|uniref:hypothetical protein n=1 Tax=Fervidobacterium gondwanense TaxID=44754 RepID=UPI003C737B4E
MSLDSLVGYMMFSVIISVVTLVLAIAYGVVIYFAIRKTREMLLEIHSSSKQLFEIVQRIEQRSEVLINSLDETKSRIEEVDSKLLRQNQILEQYQETLKELLELNTRTSDLISQTEMLKIEIQRLRDVLNEPLDLSEWVDGNGTSKE